MFETLFFYYMRNRYEKLPFVSRQLVGYSFGDSFPFHKASQFNLAEIGAVSTDMPYMVSAIIASS